MPTDLRRIHRLEISLWFKADRQRWISYCPTTNNTAWGPTREIAIEAMRGELDAEESAYETYGFSSETQPVPVGSETRTLMRRGKGRWSE